MSTQLCPPATPCHFPDLTPLTNSSSNNITNSHPSISSVKVPFSHTSELTSPLSHSPSSCPVLLTAWAILLRSYTGQDNITFRIAEADEAAPTAVNIALSESSTVAELVAAKHCLPSKSKADDSDTVVLFWDYHKGTKPSVAYVSCFFTRSSSTRHIRITEIDSLTMGGCEL
jgi:hypothetical protein